MSDIKRKIIIIDDESSIVDVLSRYLSAYDVETFTSASDALDRIKSGNKLDIVIVDYKFRMSSINGLMLLKECKDNCKNYKAIMITAFSDKELVTEILNKQFVYRIIEKPIEREILTTAVKQAIEDLQKEEEYVSSIQNTVLSLPNYNNAGVLVFKSEKMRETLDIAKKYANSNIPVFINAENGSGKEVFANIIHYYSKRKDKPFLKLNCSNFSETLFESSLFGYKKGAFSGATTDKKGYLEEYNGGTIFFDEISEMPESIQSKLLRVLENKEYIALGSNNVRTADIRIIAASNRDMQIAIKEGKFRRDLFHRFAVGNLNIPPLRDRIEDIPLLASYFLDLIAKEEGGIHSTLDLTAVDYLKNYNYSANVRELKNIITSAYISYQEEVLLKEHFVKIEKISDCYCETKATNDLFEKTIPLDEFRYSIERKYIETQIQKFNNSLTLTAQNLGVSKHNLSYYLKKYGLRLEN